MRSSNEACRETSDDMPRTCPFGYKRSYSTEQAAHIARKTLDKYGTNAKGIRVYKCPNCFHYHFTSRKD